MADYPHASAAGLCYLEERGREREKSHDAGHLEFSLFSRCPAGLSALSCWSFKIGKRTEKLQGGEESG